MKFETVYRKTGEKELPECHGTGITYEHVKTGAKVFTLKTKDPNKVFMIGFRTTPSDSTGVAHIMEHSVLCGSEKFPLKDPFVELAKGSLNTFLNAMTYPDKTVYPVASCNDKDFMNLMDVYLDAVFHPNIYKEKKIFLQEGWHYEPDEDGNLTVNGVVYNEMKGVYSSPDSVLERFTLNSLFPHNTYSFESGGDPDCIPDLSYEDFLEFHRTYYHPSNSYIYLYGDMDMEEKLLWIDGHYLSSFVRKEIHSEIPAEPAFQKKVYVEKQYGVTSKEEEAGKTFLSENFVIPQVPDSLTDLAWEIIDFVLLGAPGAPLKEELMREGFGEEIYGGYNAGILQPYFSVIAKNTEKEKLPAFREKVQEILERLVREGLDQNSLVAALNFMEFKYREEDYGRIPAGLEYGLNAMEAWLYDRAPWQFLTYDEEFKHLRERVGTGFYEDLLSAAVLSNPHSAEVVVLPKEGLIEAKDAEFAKVLAERKEKMGPEQFDLLALQAQELEDWQSKEDSEEAKRCLPVLKLSDISPEAEKVIVKVRDRVIFSELPTNGIAYVRLIFDTTEFTERQLQLAALLKNLYGELDTAKHSYKELSDEILLKTGGVDFLSGSYGLDEQVAEEIPFAVFFAAELRTLSGSISDGVRLAFEILEETSFEDEERIREKILEVRSQARSNIEDASHVAAVTRAMSYQLALERLSDLLGGIAWYDFLCDAVQKMEQPETRKAFLGELRETAEKLNHCAYDAALSGSEDMIAEFNQALKVQKKETHRRTPDRKQQSGCKTVKPVGNRKEGIIIGSMVNYVARTGRYLQPGQEYDGAADVLRILLNYEYLWINLRVKGGAYGCMSGFRLTGRNWFVSYRDPNLLETDQVYQNLPDWLEKTELSEEKVTKYIIGAIAALDHPVTGYVKAQRQLAYYYVGTTDEKLEKIRKDILSCTPQRLRAFAPRLREFLKEESVCVIGNKEKILAAGDFFKNIREIKGEV